MTCLCKSVCLWSVCMSVCLLPLSYFSFSLSLSVCLSLFLSFSLSLSLSSFSSLAIPVRFTVKDVSICIPSSLPNFDINQTGLLQVHLERLKVKDQVHILRTSSKYRSVTRDIHNTGISYLG